jgi:hypothetical protein
MNIIIISFCPPRSPVFRYDFIYYTPGSCVPVFFIHLEFGSNFAISGPPIY